MAKRKRKKGLYKSNFCFFVKDDPFPFGPFFCPSTGLSLKENQVEGVLSFTKTKAAFNLLSFYFINRREKNTCIDYGIHNTCLFWEGVAFS